MSVYVNYDQLMYASFSGHVLSLIFLGSQKLVCVTDEEKIIQIVQQLEEGVQSAQHFLSDQHNEDLGLSHFVYSRRDSTQQLLEFVFLNIQDIVYMSKWDDVLDIYFTNGFSVSIAEYMFDQLTVIKIYDEIMALL